MQRLTSLALKGQPLDDGTWVRKPLSRCILDLFGSRRRLPCSMTSFTLWRTLPTPSFLLWFSRSVGLLETKICMSLFLPHSEKKKFKKWNETLKALTNYIILSESFFGLRGTFPQKISEGFHFLHLFLFHHARNQLLISYFWLYVE